MLEIFIRSAYKYYFMKPEKNQLKKEFLKPKLGAKARITAKLDEEDIKIAEKAMIKNYEDLLNLENRIEKSAEYHFRRKSILFRLIVVCLGAIFELNFEQLGLLFIYDKNPELTRFLSKFTNSPSISEEELCKTKTYFEAFWKELEGLAYQIKADYHLFYQEYTDAEFLEILKRDKRKRPYGVALLLKGINMARWFRSEIIPMNQTYPNTSLLRALFYGALMVRKRGIAGLAQVLGEPVFNLAEEYVDLGYSLGFYFGVPSVKTLYRFINRLEPTQLYQIMKENTEELIRIGCADIGMLLVDSTEIFGRKDDPDLPAKNRKRATHKMTYRIQVICDPNQIPLIAITRLGTEIDVTGFMPVFDGLLYIKSVADQQGKQIEYVLVDAGYFDQPNLERIRTELGAQPIFNINPRRDPDLKELRSLFGTYGKKYYENLHDASLSRTEQIKVLQEAKQQIFDPIEQKCWEFVQAGTELKKIVGREILSVGVENFLDIYVRRNVIEGLIGVGKSAYLDLSNKKNKLRVMGQERVSIKVLLILIGLQFRALTNYRILRRENLVMKDLYWVKLSEILVRHEQIPLQENG